MPSSNTKFTGIKEAYEFKIEILTPLNIGHSKNAIMFAALFYT